MTAPVFVGIENFDREVLQAPTPVVVDFWAPSCAACKRLEPVVHHLANVFHDQVKIALCNVAEAPDIAREYQVMGSPTLVFFKNGRVVDTLIGYMDEPHLTAKLNQVLQA